MIKKISTKKILATFKYLFILKENKLIHNVAYASDLVRIDYMMKNISPEKNISNV